MGIEQAHVWYLEDKEEADRQEIEPECEPGACNWKVKIFSVPPMVPSAVG